MWEESRWLDIGHFFLFSSTVYGYENHQVLGCTSFDLKSLEYVAPRVKLLANIHDQVISPVRISKTKTLAPIAPFLKTRLH